MTLILLFVGCFWFWFGFLIVTVLNDSLSYWNDGLRFLNFEFWFLSFVICHLSWTIVNGFFSIFSILALWMNNSCSNFWMIFSCNYWLVITLTIDYLTEYFCCCCCCCRHLIELWHLVLYFHFDVLLQKLFEIIFCYWFLSMVTIRFFKLKNHV